MRFKKGFPFQMGTPYPNPDFETISPKAGGELSANPYFIMDHCLVSYLQ
jgi:hypothetical protein